VVSVGGLAKDDDEGMPDEIAAVLSALEGTR
jgi:cytochrome c biogenesis protein